MDSLNPKPARPTDRPRQMSNCAQQVQSLRWVTLAALSLLILGITLLGLLTFSRTNQPTTGDENSYLLQAMSLIPTDLDFSFSESDMDRWYSAGFQYSPPNGYFAQVYDDTITFGKPYTYSFLSGMFFYVFGINTGFILLNAFFLTITLVVGFLFAQKLTGRVSVALVSALSFVAFTGLPFYLFASSVEAWWFTQLMIILWLTNSFWLPLQVNDEVPRRHRIFMLASAYLLLGNLTAEKPPLGLLAMIAVTIFTARHGKSWFLTVTRVAAAAIGFSITIAPFLYYSRGASWSPYGTPRIYVKTSDVNIVKSNILSDISSGRLRSGNAYGVVRGDAFTIGDIVKRALDIDSEITQSIWYFFAGENVGIILWHVPVAMVLFAAPFTRRLKSVVTGRIAIVVGVLAVGVYSLFYLIVYPSNFFGGAHSLGNRYILQIAPFIFPAWVILLKHSALFGKIAATAIVLVVIGLSPQFSDIKTTYLRVDRETLYDHFLPFEKLGPRSSEFVCAQAYGIRLDCKS